MKRQVDEPNVIEGNLRLSDNLVKAKKLYGNQFEGKIINTKYFAEFNDPDTVNLELPTLVCKNDESLVLGKPRWPVDFEYCKIQLVPGFGDGLRSIVLKDGWIR